MPGSPPRVREELDPAWTGGDSTGITPACAGRTRIVSNHLPAILDHPRVCGKNQAGRTTVDSKKGSPPRVREELLLASFVTAPVRITPACAGRTPLRVVMIVIRQDHPRVCGKNYRDVVNDLQKGGSPPRVREERQKVNKACPGGGITPACAGRTTFCLCTGGKDEDHPRVCGKNYNGFIVLLQFLGSPPRVREELFPGILNTGYRGITPACAGRTPNSLYRKHDSWDHPRVCGKNSFPCAAKFCNSGSPPRVREELAMLQSEYAKRGITPACAGRTNVAKRDYGVNGDHPRVCGKNYHRHPTNKATVGSPPRVREELSV